MYNKLANTKLSLKEISDKIGTEIVFNPEVGVVGDSVVAGDGNVYLKSTLSEAKEPLNKSFCKEA